MALMRSPLASHTTDAGLGFSFTGQLGAGGEDGVCATGTAGDGFLDGRWAPVECAGWVLGVVGDAAGCDEDCAAPEALHRTVAAASAPTSITHCNAEEKAMRDGVADLRMGKCYPGMCAPGRVGFEPPHCIRLSVAVERS